MARSRDSQALKGAWLGWRDAVGPALKLDYEEYVALLNSGAQENGEFR